MADSFYKKIIELLKKYNCVFVRQGKGSHEIWYSPITEKNFSVPLSTKSRFTANAILQQAGITEKL